MRLLLCILLSNESLIRIKNRINLKNCTNTKPQTLFVIKIVTWLFDTLIDDYTQFNQFQIPIIQVIQQSDIHFYFKLMFSDCIFA